MHQSSFARVRELVANHLSERRGQPLRILDVGSFDVNGTYRPLFDDPEWEYVGLDTASGPGVDVVVRQPYRWAELRSASFDVVVSGQAFEHIEFPWVTILEVARVLRPGGLFVLIVPSSGPEHRHPFDCWRFYTDGIVALAHWADLDVLRAQTHWDDEGWGEQGDQWHDAELVAQRRQRAGSRRAALKRAVLRWVTNLQAGRRSAIGNAVDPSAGQRVP